MNKQVNKDKQMGGSEFIRLFCISHGIPMDHVSQITITARYGGAVEANVEHLGTYRLMEMTADGRIGDTEIIE